MKDNLVRLSLFNIRSIFTGFDLFSDFVVNENYSVIGLSETWLCDTIPDNVINIQGYKIVRKDRETRGGGVAFFIKDNFRFKILESPTPTPALEDLWISCKLAGKNVCLGTLYRPPSANIVECLSALETMLTSFVPAYDLVLFGGDLNIDMLVDSNSAKLFNNLLEKYNLTQLVSNPTRVVNNSSTLIDVIVSSSADLVGDCGIIPMDHISDHSLVECTINIKKEKIPPLFRTYRDFSKFNHDAFVHHINSLSWQAFYNTQNIDELIELWNGSILSVFDLHAPLKTARITKSPAPWLTDNLKLMMRLRDKALLKFRKSRTDENWNHYKELRNFVNTAVRQEKKAYLGFNFRSNPKQFWKTIKYLNINSCQTSSGPDFGDPNLFNNYFITSVPNNTSNRSASALEYKRKYVGKLNGTMPDFNFSKVTQEVVIDVFNTIRSNATGSDNINLKMLSFVLPHLASHLTHIINRCLLTSTVPTQWKSANVTPIPKINNPTELSHFRPVSILPTASKILEKIVFLQINSFLTKYGILSATQSGFRAHHSTTTALLRVTDDIYEANDNGKSTCLILLDYSKAFDTLEHALLCQKLKYIGFSPETVLFFASYLEGRQQRVCLNELESSFVQVRQGVPQGSVLGPILFSLYTFDFCKYIKYCSIHQYADDTQIYYSFYNNNLGDAISKINEDLNAISCISDAHNLVLNGKKTEILVFGPKKDQLVADDDFKVSLNGEVLKFSTCVKNLGLLLDTNLRFDSYVKKLVQKSYYKLKLLYMNKDILSPDIKLRLCDSLILSTMSYCDVVYWPALLNRDKESLQKIQNSCIRFVYGLRKFDHISDKLVESGWLKMDERYQASLATTVYNINKFELPAYLYSKLVRGSDVHNRQTRSRLSYKVPRHRTAQFQRSFAYNSVKTFNSIPLAIRSLTNVSTFRKQVKRLIRSKRN